jgi:hypothetical protein
VSRSSADDRAAAAVAAALAPYAWREFTEHMLARRVVGALDRHAVVAFLTGLTGTDVGSAGAVEPAEKDDERVEALVRFLNGQLWRSWSLARLCAVALSSLTVWRAERHALDSGLRWLLDGR